MKVRPTIIVAASFLASFWSSLPAQERPPRVETPPGQLKVAPTETRPMTPPGRDPRLPMQAPIQKPADPAKVKATYELNGQRVDITEGEFFDTYQRLEKLEPKVSGRMVDQNRVYEHMLAFAEAKALGLEATPEEVALFDPLATNKPLADATKARHEKEGITPEMYAAYQREARTIQKLKDLFANNMRTLSSDLFETYKRDHFSVRLEFVEFSSAKHAEEIKTKTPTDEELQAFWNEDKAVQAAHRLQSTVTAEFVSFDPSKAAPANGADREVTRDEALSYYNQNKTRLDSFLTPEQRAALYPGGKVDVATLQTPFQILRPIIDREIKVSGKIRTAFGEARKPGADFAAIAKKHDLAYERIEKADRETMATKYLKYGPQVVSVLSAMNPGDVSPELKMEPQVQFFYRLVDKEAARLPPFEEVKSKLVAAYVETTAKKGAEKAAQAMRTWIDQKVDAEIRAEEETMLAKAKEKADGEIKERGLTQKAEIDSVTNRFKQQAMAEVRQKKDGLASKYFDQYVKDQGLTVQDTGLFETGLARRDHRSGQESKHLSFIKQLPLIRTMEPGQVTQVLTDHAMRGQLIARLVERSEPDYSAMTDGDLLAIRSQTERANQHKPLQRWLYAEISRRRDLKPTP